TRVRSEEGKFFRTPDLPSLDTLGGSLGPVDGRRGIDGVGRDGHGLLVIRGATDDGYSRHESWDLPVGSREATDRQRPPGLHTFAQPKTDVHSAERGHVNPGVLT